VVYNFLAESTKELSDNLILNTGVLRHMIMAIPEEYTPFTGKELEVGMERIRAEKTIEREKRHGGPRKKREDTKKNIIEKAPPVKRADPITESVKKVEPKAEEPAAPEVKAEEPTKESVPIEEPSTTKPRELKEKTKEEKAPLTDLDKKLEKIFDDDEMDLGF